MAFIDPGDSSSDMYRAVALRTVRELGDDEVTPLARSSASALRVNRRNESQSVWRKAEPLARPKKKQREPEARNAAHGLELGHLRQKRLVLPNRSTAIVWPRERAGGAREQGCV